MIVAYPDEMRSSHGALGLIQAVGRREEKTLRDRLWGAGRPSPGSHGTTRI